jgi:hypothetical protein
MAMQQGIVQTPALMQNPDIFTHSQEYIIYKNRPSTLRGMTISSNRFAKYRSVIPAI